jgi:hypothetical protein
MDYYPETDCTHREPKDDCEFCGLDCSAPHPCIFGMAAKELVTEGARGLFRTTLHPRHDPVNSPDHYQLEGGWEVIDITENMNFNKGNAVKYVLRAGKKDDEVQDLAKAVWYLQREIARLSDD